MAYASVAGNAWTGAWPRVSLALFDRGDTEPSRCAIGARRTAVRPGSGAY